MPQLGLLLVSAFSTVVAWLAQWFTRKVAYTIAVGAAYSTITLGLFVLMRTTLAALSSLASGSTLPTMFVKGLGMAIPPAAPACIAAYVTIWTACTAYYWQRDLIKLAAST